MRITLLTGLIGLALTTGCSHDSWKYQAVPDVALAPADTIASSGALLLKTEPKDQLTAKPADGKDSVTKTILIVSWKHDSGTYRSSVGKTLVITLDAPIKKGQIWLSPDNSVLVNYSAYSAPTRERVHLSGSIDIKEIGTDEIVADVAVRDVEDVDASGFLDHPYDAQYRQWPFKMTGERKFKVTHPGDPEIDQSAVKWEMEK